MSKATDQLTIEAAGLAAAADQIKTYVGMLLAAPGADDAAVTAANGVIAGAKSVLAGLLPVQVLPLAVSPSSLSVTVGTAFTAQLAVTGGVGPYNFAPPAGVTVDPTGAVSGDETVAGDAAIEVADSSTPPLTISVPIVAA